jgi:hypothetical protein
MSLDRALLDRARALVAALEGASVERVDSLDRVSTDGLLRSIATLGDLTRAADSMGAVITAEVTRRVQTDAGFRREALGGDVGGRLASELVRDLAHVDDDDLRDWERVAEAIAPRTSLQGEPLPCRHSAVADAVLSGEISARAAAIITRGIDRVADFADAESLDALEKTLIEYAGSLTTRELTRLVRQVDDRFDPDGAEPREEALRRRSGVTVKQLPDGITRIIADLHPEAAGFVLAALDARTSPRRLPRFLEAGDDGDVGEAELLDPSIDDDRTLAQQRVDALTSMARESLAADPGAVGGTAVTMLVTVPLETLQSGVGVAQIAGVDEPICAGTARRLAADAQLIPVVLGTASEPLDLGRNARLYSEAQRRALAVRDGGCVWPGCDAPPAWCEVAHLTAWILDGPTDLDNGALMCRGHHHRFDRDGWQLERRDGIPYLIPPPWLDAARTPRRGGRILATAA